MRKVCFELVSQMQVKILQNFLIGFVLVILNVYGGGCIFPKAIFGLIA